MFGRVADGAEVEPIPPIVIMLRNERLVRGLGGNLQTGAGASETQCLARSALGFRRSTGEESVAFAKLD